MRAAPYISKLSLPGSLAALALLLASCGSPSGELESSAPKKAAASQTTAPETPQTNIRMAVFQIDKSSRDPFFPNSKKLPPGVQPEVKEAAPVNLTTILQEQFQGIMGAGADRLAVINNVILEPGKKTEIPLRVNGSERMFKVRCQKVTASAVTLEVEGHPMPITIAAKKMRL